jgi:small-conductance mechanosensitive channel/CRP-like cAMP-binding protein
VQPGFFDHLWRWAIDGRTFWLLGGLLVLIVVVARMPADKRPRIRVTVSLVVAHVAALLIAAGLKAGGYSPNAYLVAALAFSLFAAIGMTSVLVFRRVLPRLGLALPQILIDIITGVAALVAMIAVGKKAGLSLAGLITTSAVLTAVIGFALQDTLGNMMSGIALQMDRSINLGDWIKLGDGTPPGRVTEIRWRYTAIETTAWSTIIIPNSVLTKSQVTVIGRRIGEAPYQRRDVDFFVDFRTPPNEVIDTVRDSLLANPVPRMSAQPEVQVLFFGLRDSVSWYRVRYWLTDLAVEDPTDAEIRTRVYYALRRAGITFSIPAQTLFITAEDDARKQRQGEKELKRRIAAISKVDLLAVLEEDERKRVAALLHYAPFARGEAMTREGDADDGLYMIVEGEASVQVSANGGRFEVARLGPGQFFGEMSLMTGEKRSATVIAGTDVVTYRLDKPAFEELVKSRPEIAEAVADLLTERRESLDQARNEIDEASRRRRRQSTKHDILGRIRGFFNLGG